MKTNYPECLFERYADDAIVHCKTLDKTERILKGLKTRMKKIGLELHHEKTRIAYCKMV